jgi:hypothetical protein
MIRVLKTLFFLLLMVALPVQGLASVMKASCGPAHHSALPVAVTADQHPHDDGAIHSHQHLDDATMHPVADNATQASPDSSVTADKSSGTFTSSYCSACAACCAGAVAPPSALNWPADHSSSQTVLVAPAPLVTGHIPDGLKRPPRHISA